MYFLVASCFALSIALCAGQDCYGGNLHENVKTNDFTPSYGQWYLNLQDPASCSGKVLKYKVAYFDTGGLSFPYKVQMALWKPREGESVYDKVDNNPTQFSISNNKRKKRDSKPGNSDDIDVSNNGLYVRKGSVIGVYFSLWSLQLKVIGEKNGNDYLVCNKAGPLSTLSLNCTTDSLVSNLVIYAHAEIEMFECSNAQLQYDNTENAEYIDGDQQYGARVHYQCIMGFKDSNSHEYLTCNENNDWVGTEPNCVRVVCDNITSLINGNVTIQNGFSYQSIVSFTCNTGYNLNGSSSITCQADETWSSDIPTCDIVKCDNQSAPNNGYKYNHNLTYGSSIQFGCDNGYKLSSDLPITCQADGTWSSNVPNCVPVNCTDLDEPNNGKKSSSLITFGSIVLFNCDEGYYANGTGSIICQADMSWNDSIPSCILIDCGSPGEPSNGSAIGSNYSYNSVVMFDCDYGYELTGSASVICGNHSNWNASTPSCNLVSCGSPVIDNNTIISLNSSYTYMSVVQFECLIGYNLHGNTSAVCQANGEWNVTSPSCIPVSCTDPGVPVNGSIANEPSFTYSTIIEYECNIGYNIVGWPIIVCEADQKWNGTVPTCEIVNCGSPGNPTYGKNVTDGENFDYLSIVDYECNDGYKLEGNSSIMCTALGTWNSSVSICNPVNCGEPNEIENGYRIGSNYTFGYSIEYNCQVGYNLIGSNILQCTENGTWSASEPVCEIVQCSNASILNGIKIGDNHTYTSMISFICDDGYNLNGTTNITCQSNGEWTSPVPTCIPVHCGNPGNPTYGKSITDSENFDYPSIVDYECNDGYELEGNSSIMCTALGTWNSSVPICNPVNCGEPNEIENGYRIGSNYTFGYSVEYNCQVGYNLIGSNILQCTENGTWSASEPVCEIVQCSNASILNGIKIGDNHTYTSMISFICDDGYNLNGTANITCQSNGEWTSSVPTCLPVDCGNPGNPEMGSQNENATYTFGSVVTFICDKGYEMNNGSTITMCQANGNWTNTVLPDCSIISCDPPESPINGAVVGNTYTFGSTINYLCNAGFELVGGQSSSVCLKDKNWSIKTPKCNRVCSQLQVSFPLMIVKNKKDIYIAGDVVVFSCDDGYNLNGESTLICNDNGQWNGSITVDACELSPVTLSSSKSISLSTASVISPTGISGDSSSSGPATYGAVVGVLIVFIVIIIVTIIMILLVFKNRRAKKKKYNVSNVNCGNSIGSNGQILASNTLNSSITLKKLPVHSVDDGTVSAYEVPLTLQRSQTDTMIKTSHEMGVTLPRSKTHTLVTSPYEVPVTLKRDLTNTMDTSATPYEVPLTLPRSQTNTMAKTCYKMPERSQTNTMIKRDLSADQFMKSGTQPSYETVNSTGSLVKTNLSSLVEEPLDFDLPPIITETSFIDNIGEDEVPQDYSELDQAFEKTAINTIDVTNLLYSEINGNSSSTQNIPQEDYSELDQAFEQTPINGNTTTDVTNILYSEINGNDFSTGSLQTDVTNILYSEYNGDPSMDNNTISSQRTSSTSKRKTIIYEPPATETDELFIQLKRQNVRGIKSNWINIGKKLGSGYFGNVCKGEMRTDPDTEDTIEVAIKTLNDRATERDKIKFLQEAAIMAQFNHTNVLKLHGVVVAKDTYMIVTELMTKGDLVKVLKKMRPDPGLLNNEDMPFTLLNFCRQVCFGLSHLAQKGFIHRDIAARNILVDDNSTCKIADFGMSRDLDEDDYYMANEGAKVPVKWTAPEALHYRKYSSASDVWSYGCLLYEIWGLGAKPFQKMTNIQSLEKVDKGYRLPPPPGCPKELYNLMIQCWHPDKDARPCFQDMMLIMLGQDKVILSIPEEDLSSHPLAGTIGATLEAGEKMYEKLQMTYC